MSPPPRVVIHLRPTNFYGGPEKQVVEHAVLLPDLGWRPIVATFQENRSRVELLDRAIERGLDTASIPTSGPFDVGAIGRLRDLLWARESSLLVAHGYKAIVVGLHAGRAARIPVIACVRGFTGESPRVRLYEALEQAYLKRMQVVVALSEAGKQMLCSLGVRPERIHVVPNAVHLPLEPVEPADLRSEFRIPEAEPLLVAAGRLSPEKDHQCLIRAISLLRSHMIPVHLVILGSGPQQAALVEIARENGVLDRLHFAGFRHDVLSCLAAGDIVVNPSYKEGMPNVILEAMSIGAPVIATAVGGVPEIIEHGRTGWLVSPSSPEKLAEQIRVTLADPHLRYTVGATARDAVLRGFDFHSQAIKWVRLYDACIGSRSR